jgi:hypothetical protein
MFGVHTFASNDVLLGDLWWVASEVRLSLFICYWNRMIKMDNSRLTKKVFNHEYEKVRGRWTKLLHMYSMYVLVLVGYINTGLALIAVFYVCAGCVVGYINTGLELIAPACQH